MACDGSQSLSITANRLPIHRASGSARCSPRLVCFFRPFPFLLFSFYPSTRMSDCWVLAFWRHIAVGRWVQKPFPLSFFFYIFPQPKNSSDGRHVVGGPDHYYYTGPPFRRRVSTTPATPPNHSTVFYFLSLSLSLSVCVPLDDDVVVVVYPHKRGGTYPYALLLSSSIVCSIAFPPSQPSPSLPLNMYRKSASLCMEETSLPPPHRNAVNNATDA